MSAQNNGQRVFILVIVAVFVLTAVGTTAAVIYDAATNKDKTSTTSSTANGSTEQNQQTQKIEPQEGKLEGTKLTGFAPITSVPKLEIIDLIPGTGAEATSASTITAHYTGALAKDGTIFQSSKDTNQTFTTQLSGVIAGWQEGIPGMKVGGTRRLVIPAAQAYGAQAAGNIPANSDLVFDIELVDVK